MKTGSGDQLQISSLKISIKSDLPFVKDLQALVFTRNKKAVFRHKQFREYSSLENDHFLLQIITLFTHTIKTLNVNIFCHDLGSEKLYTLDTELTVGLPN